VTEEPAAPARPGATSRTVADAPSLRALTHPTRLALIEAIGLAGTLTATQASEQVGESPTACAYHLRMLARHGFIEEAGGGRGRERPWRLGQTSLSVEEDSDDPAVALASRALTTMVTEMWIGRIRAFELARAGYSREIRDATGVIESIVFATPAEQAALRAEILALMSRYTDRMDPSARPPGALPFEMVLFTHLLRGRS
jgi:hypothetical protein